MIRLLTLLLSALALAFCQPTTAPKNTSPHPRGALLPSSINAVIPHITHGSYWRSTLIIMNVSVDPAFYRIQFFQPNGNNASFKSVELGNVHEVYGVLQPGGSARLRSIVDASPTETLYWAEIVEGSGKIQVTTVFTLNFPGIQPVEFTVPNTDYLSLDRIYFPFDNTEGNGTAIALANAVDFYDMVYRVEARNEFGANIFSGTISLAARHNMTGVLSSMFPQLANQKGVIVLSADASSPTSLMYCSPLVLRFNAGWSLTYIPAYDQY